MDILGILEITLQGYSCVFVNLEMITKRLIIKTMKKENASILKSVGSVVIFKAPFLPA